MLITTTVENTITIKQITHIIHQSTREERVQIKVSIPSPAVHLIGIVLNAHMQIISRLPIVKNINSVIRRMENLNAIHVLNSVNIARTVI